MSPGNGLIGVGQRPKISEGLHIIQSLERPLLESLGAGE